MGTTNATMVFATVLLAISPLVAVFLHVLAPLR